ncbi:DNA primase catalytic subunit PriS [Candidatus Micrarchaeota archaeon]|nr:DNA primase catalytic subunit PriS [Candidatus Micrarchaeota archaeon]
MEQNYIRQKFQEYYQKNPIEWPPEVSRREFGFGSWEKKIESRHSRFSDYTELKNYLVRNTPFFISYSTAYYEFPDARPMERKNWLKADLVFDLDADQLKLSCLATHTKDFPCDNCLEKIKLEAIKLVEEFLVTDLGFSKDDITINFSGNRGYHVHVFDKKIQKLNADARRELIDYVCGTGLNFDSLFYLNENRLLGPKTNDGGWSGKVANHVINLVRSGSPTLPAKLRKNEEIKNKVITGIANGNWDVVAIPKKQELWKNLLGGVGVALGDKIDQNVTGDVSKLIRLANSLHGETGLIAKIVKDINNFDPLKHATAFGNQEVKVEISNAPKFRIGDQYYGPYNNNTTSLPEVAAIYLICKKRAKLAK